MYQPIHDPANRAKRPMSDLETTEQDFTEAQPADRQGPGVRMRIAVVLNNTAGALLDRKDMLERLVAQFERLGFDPDFIPAEAGSRNG